MNWSAIWNDIISMDPGIGEICLRLGCAMLVGLVIGTEREYTNRPAGMRTHILVALGACVASIMGEMIFLHYSANADPARLSAQVITGVGFLGAGTIMREGASVKGLTTAASVWAVACLGLAAGFGYYALAIAGMVFIFITLTIFEAIQNKLVNASGFQQEYILETTDISAALALINTQAEKEQAQIHNILSETLEDGCRITFKAEFYGSQSKKRRQRFFSALAAAPETRSVHHPDQIQATI